MFALLINPDLGDIMHIQYRPEEFDSHAKLLHYLLGDEFQFEQAFRNGDYLYTTVNSQVDMYGPGFEMDGVSDLLYGRAVVVGCNFFDGSLKNPATTLSDLWRQIHFYTQQETAEINSGNLFRELGCFQ